jgi:hypothetical protein
MVKSCLAVCVLAVASASWGSTPRSESYSFDYATVGLGGGISASADYQLVAFTDDNGSSNPSASATYQIEPAVGAPSSPRAAVKTWALYD